MKIKTLSVLAGIGAPLIGTAHASAGFVGLNVVGKPNDFGLIVCNVYVEFDRPGEDLMTSVSGTSETPMLIQVLGGGTFFNSGFGDDKAPNSAFFQAFPTLEFDTFVTIGIKFTNPLDDALIIAPDFPVGITGTQLAFSNSAWAITPVDPQGDPFDPDYVAGNGQVLIAQFATADGTGFSGTFQIGYTSNGVSGLRSAVSFFHVPTPGALALLGTAGLLGDRRRRRPGRSVRSGLRRWQRPGVDRPVCNRRRYGFQRHVPDRVHQQRRTRRAERGELLLRPGARRRRPTRHGRSLRESSPQTPRRDAGCSP